MDNEENLATKGTHDEEKQCKNMSFINKIRLNFYAITLIY